MLDEAALRTRTFQEGPRVRLADGELWTLPAKLRDGDDPALEDLLGGILDAEDEAERLRAELALTIFTLSHNYHLTPLDYQELLGFGPASAGLDELQTTIHEMALDALRTRARPSVADRAPARPSPAWGFVGNIYQALRLRLLGRVP